MNVINVQPIFDLTNPKTLKFDPGNPKPKDVISIIELIERDVKANPVLNPLPVVTGWNEIDPAKAIELLRRNPPGANRKIDPGTVVYYATQMARGQWKETGQPILFDSDGNLVDAQHRLYAIILSGATIRCYVVTEIKVIPHLFAYIDNSRPRTAATALQTSGYNGVAAIIVKVIKLAEEVRLGRYDSSGISKLPRLTPAETLDLAAHYPNAQMAARSAVTDWDGVDDLLGGRRTEIVAYLGMQISDLHGADVADDFYEEVTNPEERDDNPVLALRKAIEQDNKKQKPMMKRQHHLAALILTFNAWHKNEALGKRWMQLVTDDMPRVDAPVSTPPEEEEAA